MESVHRSVLRGAEVGTRCRTADATGGGVGEANARGPRAVHGGFAQEWARDATAGLRAHHGKVEPKTAAVVAAFARMGAGLGPWLVVGSRGIALRSRLPRTTAVKHIEKLVGADVLQRLGSEGFSRTTRWHLALGDDARTGASMEPRRRSPDISAIEQHWHAAALGHEARAVWAALTDHDTVREIAGATELTGDVVKTALETLRANGLVERIGRTSGSRWRGTGRDPAEVCGRNGMLQAVRNYEEELRAEIEERRDAVAQMRSRSEVDRQRVLRGLDVNNPPPLYGASPDTIPWGALYVVTHYVEWLEERGAAVPRSPVSGLTYAQLCREELEAGYTMSDGPLSFVGFPEGE